jgi:ribose transport system permease protein
MLTEFTKLLTKFNISWRDMGTVAGLLIMVIVFSSLSNVFLTERNLVNILQQSSINGCIAIGMTLVIISGGIDLSVGPTSALSAVLSATLLMAGYPVPIVIATALVIGLACGMLNGILIAYAGLQPFIVTLGTLSVFRSLGLIYTGGNPVLGLPNTYRQIFTTFYFGLPVPVLIVAVLAIVAFIMLKKTPLGEYILAVGGNEEAARVSGVPIERTKVITYMISGGLASLAAVILMARLGAAEPTLGNLWELEAIAAAAIGGASLMGGKGSIFGTILGAIVLGAMRNGLTLLNVQAFYQLLATGIIIILAMLVDRLARGRG